MKKQKPYPAELEKPLPSSLNQESRRKLIDQKFTLLFEHYDLDRANPINWAILTMHLAFRHIRGFSAPTTVGRKEEWSIEKHLLLLHAIAPLIGRGKSVRSACKELKKKSPFNEWKAGAETLRKKYQDGKKWTPLNLQLFAELTSAPEKFQAYKDEIKRARDKLERATHRAAPKLTAN